MRKAFKSSINVRSRSRLEAFSSAREENPKCERMGMQRRTIIMTSWANESGRGLPALHNLAGTLGTLEPRASVMECGQSSAAFSQPRRQSQNFSRKRPEPADERFGISALRPLLLLLCVLAIAAIPFQAHAHGELLIRIGQLTRQLATNGTAQLYLERGELYREDRNWSAAETDYARAADLGYPMVKVDFRRAKLLADQEKFQQARKILDKVIEKSSVEGDVFVARARVLVRLNQRQAALADFARGAQLLTATEPEVFLDWAQALADEGTVDEALERLDQGIGRVGPNNLLLVYALELELEQNNLDGALARLAVIIEHADRKERWLAQKGDIERAAGRTMQARKSYEAALAAIRLLPVRLQKNPPMQSLTAQINAGLAELGTGT